MKKILILVLILFSVSSASAFWEKKSPVKPAKKAVVISKETKAVDFAPQAALSAKTWLVYLKIIGSKDSNLDTDILSFSDNLFSSKNLGSKGFSAVSYNVQKTDDGAIQWEVMQAAKDSSLAFWKGELKADVLRGILSLQAKGADLIDYEFSTIVPDKGER